MIEMTSSQNGAVPAAAHRFLLWGPLTTLGLAAALLTAVIDQASKLWLIYFFDLGARCPPVSPRPPECVLTPFLDMVLIWNKGISYGLFPQQGPLGQWTLFGLKVVAAVLLWIWLARASSRLTAIALGLIIGGAIGNAIDRALAMAGFVHEGVADFILFHLNFDWPLRVNFEWYVFNIADVAIVAGVVGLIYDGLFGAAKAP
jgi:signal peptidase II